MPRMTPLPWPSRWPPCPVPAKALWRSHVAVMRRTRRGTHSPRQLLAHNVFDTNTSPNQTVQQSTESNKKALTDCGQCLHPSASVYFVLCLSYHYCSEHPLLAAQRHVAQSKVSANKSYWPHQLIRTVLYTYVLCAPLTHRCAFLRQWNV